jgi:hypothetical protein
MSPVAVPRLTVTVRVEPDPVTLVIEASPNSVPVSSKLETDPPVALLLALPLNVTV